jgi:hypothetical protein
LRRLAMNFYLDKEVLYKKIIRWNLVKVFE